MNKSTLLDQNSYILWVSCLILNTNRKILLVLEWEDDIWKKKHQRSLVFGKVKKNESTLDAVVREVKEETWLLLDTFNKINSQLITIFNVNFFVDVFISIIDIIELPQFINKDTIAIRFLTLQEITELDYTQLRPWTLEMIIKTLYWNNYFHVKIDSNVYDVK